MIGHCNMFFSAIIIAIHEHNTLNVTFHVVPTVLFKNTISFLKAFNLTTQN
jgi:hypothetical protein